MWTRIGIMLAFGVWLAGGVVQAEGIYKWVDKQGQVHYGDTPGGNHAQAVTVRPAPPDDPAAARRRQQQDKLLHAMDAEHAAAAQRAAKDQQRAAVRQRNCAQARVDLENYTRFPVIYERDAQGNKHYLNDTARTTLIDKARAAVARWCQ